MFRVPSDQAGGAVGELLLLALRTLVGGVERLDPAMRGLEPRPGPGSASSKGIDPLTASP